jgi:hypothetical protein
MSYAIFVPSLEVVVRRAGAAGFCVPGAGFCVAAGGAGFWVAAGGAGAAAGVSAGAAGAGDVAWGPLGALDAAHALA